MRTILICIPLIILAIGGIAAPAPKVIVEFSINHDPKTGPENVILITFNNPEMSEQLTNLVHIGEGAPLDPKSYGLKAKIDGTETIIPITAISPIGVTAGYASSLSLNIDPKYALSTTNEYSLIIRKGTLYLRDNPTTVSANSDNTFPLDSKDLAIDETFVKPRGRQNKFAIHGGTGGGVGSFLYTYRASKINGRDWLNAEAELKGDFNFQSNNKQKYFNNMVGEVKLVAPFKWYLPGTKEGEKIAKSRYSEVDVHFRMESDQTFANADKIIGASIGTYLKDPISKMLTAYYPLNGFTKATEPPVSPLLIVGYDYASRVTTDKNPSNVPAIDTHDGNNRLRALLYWSMPFGRQLDLGLIGITRRVDVDTLFEVGGIYDFRVQKFLDQSRISLNLSPSTASQTRMVYSLSWERGKAAPTFKDVNAILAGLKVSF